MGRKTLAVGLEQRPTSISTAPGTKRPAVVRAEP
jgi:hypothetical protein